jgi:hypothetical protein
MELWSPNQNIGLNNKRATKDSGVEMWPFFQEAPEGPRLAQTIALVQLY